MWKQASQPSFSFGVPSFAGMSSTPVRRIVFQLACLTPLLIPLNWLFGTTLLWVALVTILACFCWRPMSSTEWAITAVMALLILGWGIGLMNGMPGDRSLGSIFNLVVLFVLLAFVNIGRTIGQDTQRDKIIAKMMGAAFICFCVMMIYMIALRLTLMSVAPEDLSVRSLIVGLAGTLQGSLNEYTTLDLANIDWTPSGPAWRLFGFGVFSTEGSYLAAVMGLFAILHARRRYGLWVVYILEGFVLVALLLTGSRTTLLAYFISLAVWSSIYGRYWKEISVLAFPAMIAGGALMVVYGFDVAQDFIDNLVESRSGSSGTRFTSYLLAIQMVMEQNPLTGLGYKPRIESLLNSVAK